MKAIAIEHEIIAGIIYSQFHSKIGPTAIAWIPSELSIEIREYVSLKSINILLGEHGTVPKSLSNIPFPSIDLKGLVKCFEIKDLMQRGGAIDCSITLLFNESNDPIFYKHLDNFDVIFEECVTKILEMAKEKKEVITDELKKFQGNINNLLNELRATENSTPETESFPPTEEEEGKGKDLKGYRFKIIVCGDPAVGKTSTVLRFTDKAFRRSYIPTIGVNISEKQILLGKTSRVTFIIWDIAGQSKFQMTRKYFYKGANGQILVFDLTRPETFSTIPKWYEDIKKQMGSSILGLILGNKSDLIDQRKISPEAISKLSKELGLEFVETSAFSGDNIEAAFSKLGELLIQTYERKVKEK